MGLVTVSPKCQVVIPKKERKALGIRPGQKIQVILYEGRLELIPVMSAKRAPFCGRRMPTSRAPKA